MKAYVDAVNNHLKACSRNSDQQLFTSSCTAGHGDTRAKKKSMPLRPHRPIYLQFPNGAETSLKAKAPAEAAGVNGCHLHPAALKARDHRLQVAADTFRTSCSDTRIAKATWGRNPSRSPVTGLHQARWRSACRSTCEGFRQQAQGRPSSSNHCLDTCVHLQSRQIQINTTVIC